MMTFRSVTSEGILTYEHIFMHTDSELPALNYRVQSVYVHADPRELNRVYVQQSVVQRSLISLRSHYV